MMSALRKENDMRTVPFDTLAYVKKLKSGGMEERQAEVQAEALIEIFDDNFLNKRDIFNSIDGLSQRIETVHGDLTQKIEASHSDLTQKIEASHSGLTQKIELLRADIKGDIEIKFSGVIKWVFAISFAQAALILSALKLFH